ncbi:MAG: hypothetical protein Q9221_004224 [Calogaya cf. arnoldii]
MRLDQTLMILAILSSAFSLNPHINPIGLDVTTPGELPGNWPRTPWRFDIPEGFIEFEYYGRRLRDPTHVTRVVIERSLNQIKNIILRTFEPSDDNTWTCSRGVVDFEVHLEPDTPATKLDIYDLVAWIQYLMSRWDETTVEIGGAVLFLRGKTGATDTASSEPQARHVVYCGVCSLPPEYCEFGGTAKKCKDWLEKNHPDLHEKLYSEEAVAATLSTLSLDAQKRAAKDSQKKEAKAAAAEAKAAETKAQAQILIKRVERNKRKYVTAVSGLEAHGMDLKKVAKEWGKKFATGSSVTKTASGGEEVVVQGDNSDEIFDWVVDVAGVPEANVDCIEDKKKKAA